MTTALLDRLRTATQNAHRELEDEHAPLRQPLSQARFQTVPQPFYQERQAAAPELPPGGFSFFNPYRDETGARRRGVVACAETARPTATDEVVQGAVYTFRQLRLWLAPGLPA